MRSSQICYSYLTACERSELAELAVHQTPFLFCCIALKGSMTNLFREFEQLLDLIVVRESQKSLNSYNVLSGIMIMEFMKSSLFAVPRPEGRRPLWQALMVSASSRDGGFHQVNICRQDELMLTTF